MATSTITSRTTGLSAFSLRSLFARINDWNETRRTRNALSLLSAHELNDIGLAPGDIDRIAKRLY